MTRGVLLILLLLILLSIQNTYNSYRLKNEIQLKEKLLMDQQIKDTISNQELMSIIAQKDKEIGNLQTLLNLEKDKTRYMREEIVRLLNENTFKLREIKSLADTSIVKNLEKLLETNIKTNNR
jgi:hypothetical protein